MFIEMWCILFREWPPKDISMFVCLILFWAHVVLSASTLSDKEYIGHHWAIAFILQYDYFRQLMCRFCCFGFCGQFELLQIGRSNSCAQKIHVGSNEPLLFLPVLSREWVGMGGMMIDCY